MWGGDLDVRLECHPSKGLPPGDRVQGLVRPPPPHPSQEGEHTRTKGGEVSSPGCT